MVELNEERIVISAKIRIKTPNLLLTLFLERLYINITFVIERIVEEIAAKKR
jgi:hypothetical protein